jgi:hypothetical protein
MTGNQILFSCNSKNSLSFVHCVGANGIFGIEHSTYWTFGKDIKKEGGQSAIRS